MLDPLPRRTSAPTLAWRLLLALAIAAPTLATAQSAEPSPPPLLDTVKIEEAPASRRTGAQAPSKELVDRGHRVLEQVREDIVRSYYDSTFHGLNLDSAYAAAQASIGNAATVPEVFGAVAQFVSTLHDSHTNFYPPSRVAKVDYGFRLQFIGDSCFILGVTKGSDAEAKGLTRGDAVLQWDVFRVERKSWRTLNYVYNTLSPRAVIRLLVQRPGGERRQIDLNAKITMGERTIDPNDPSQMRRLWDEYERQSRVANHIYRSIGDSVLVWKMRSFDSDEDAIKKIMKDVRKHRAVVLDLRGNGGGLVTTQLFFTGQFLDHDVEIWTQRSRGGDKAMVAKGNTKEPWKGMLIILVDSRSASASEITSRALQYMGRAIVIGDRTMGAVTAARYYPREVGFSRVLDYGTQITVSDVIMADGKRLENVGVEPDILVLPSSADIVARRDPQMAKALELVGVKMSPEDAAQVYRGAELR